MFRIKTTDLLNEKFQIIEPNKEYRVGPCLFEVKEIINQYIYANALYDTGKHMKDYGWELVNYIKDKENNIMTIKTVEQLKRHIKISHMTLDKYEYLREKDIYCRYRKGDSVDCHYYSTPFVSGTIITWRKDIINEITGEVIYKRGELVSQEYTLTDPSIDDLKLSIRSTNCLKRHGIKTLSELRALPIGELLTVRNLGKKSFHEVIDKLVEIGEHNAHRGEEEILLTDDDDCDTLFAEERF